MRILRSLLAVVLTLWTAACSRETPRRAESFEPHPIILISIDTLRADRLPAWGGSGVETPAIDSLANDSIVFLNAYSHVPLTLPSHISILTGLLPQEHGVRNNVGYQWDPERHPPVTDHLESAGFRTAGAVSAYVLRGNTGLREAFQDYEDSIASRTGVSTGSLQRPGSETTAIANRWIAEHRDQPFFYMLHLFEPHSPWEPPEPFATTYAGRPYDGEVAAVDRIVGDFIDFLKAQGLYDRSTIILLSDHGEGLGDHGELEHGIFLYREAIHVPLSIKLPDSRAIRKEAAPVQLIDVAPTILELAGVADPVVEPRGISLLGKIAGSREIYSETLYPRVHLGWSELRSLIDARYHYIEAPRPELFDHVADQAERVDILNSNRRQFATMRRTMDEIGREVTQPIGVSSEEAASLAALGYIGTLRRESDGDLPDPKDQIAEFERFRVATALAAAGRQEEAVRAFRAIVSENPRFGDAWSLLAATYERMGMLEEAIQAYGNGIRHAPALADEMALSVAGVYLRVGKLDEATAHAKLAIDTAPDAVNQVLARVHIARGEFERADELARIALQDPTLRPRSFVILAQSKAKQGRLDDALSLLLQGRKEAEERHQSVEYLEFAIGDINAMMQRWDEAEYALTKEITAFPWNLQAYANLAVVCAMQKRDHDVDRVLERMYIANPTRNACLTAATTLRSLGDEASAQRWERRAMLPPGAELPR